jgi:hypothetical protein
MFAGVFRGWLVLNGLLDLIPLGIIPILFPDFKVPGPNLLELFPGTKYTLAHRAVGYGFMMCGFCRFAAGWSKTGSAVNLATLSYLMEIFMFAVEVFKYQTTTLEAVLPGFIVPGTCVLLMLGGVLNNDKQGSKPKKN